MATLSGAVPVEPVYQLEHIIQWPPSFSGVSRTEDPLTCLDSSNTAAPLNNWTTSRHKHETLSVVLKGAAREWFDTIIPVTTVYDDATGERFVNQFTNKFVTDTLKRQYKRDYKNRVQETMNKRVHIWLITYGWDSASKTDYSDHPF